MIDVVSTASGLRAVDSAKSSIEVDLERWTQTNELRAVPRPTDHTVGVRTTSLRFPPVMVVADRLDEEETYELGSDTGPLELPTGEYVVRFEGNILVYVYFSGCATLSKPEYEESVLTLSEPTDVTIGFRSRARMPIGSITVPETPDGIATALSSFPAAYRTLTPDRSYPTMRNHPPLVEFGEETHIPDLVADRLDPNEVELTLPPDLSYLFPAASLVHYLGATVRLADGATPTLSTRAWTHELPLLPNFQWEVADILRRVFLLDCLTRNAGPYGTELAETRHLGTLSLDSATLYEAAIGERLEAYLDAPFELVSDELPEWHLSMYIEPTYEHVETLPYLLGNVPNIFLPESKPLSGNERLTRSLDDFYRREAQSVSVNLVDPVLGPGRTHGWLADGAPIDVFKALPSAYPNQFKYYDRSDDSISVVAVLNDRDMESEHTEAASVYRRRAEELDIDITIRENLTIDELARVFERPNDLVHYIGHCEETGLRCSNGNLSISCLKESNAQTFFLNACGSFHEGIDLVRHGSVAGAVTFNKVLDSHAARVGTMFARLLINGFSIERALQMARRRIIMGKDYTVVGNGTHVLAQSDNIIPSHANLERIDDDTFRLFYDAYSPRINGSYYQPYLQSDGQSRLLGTNQTFEIDRLPLLQFLEHADIPVLYEGDLHWSDNLKNTL